MQPMRLSSVDLAAAAGAGDGQELAGGDVEAGVAQGADKAMSSGKFRVTASTLTSSGMGGPFREVSSAVWKIDPTRRKNAGFWTRGGICG